MNSWSNCKNILIIRADNMGDLIMSSPAIRAVRNAFKCNITLLASAAAASAALLIEDINEVIIADLPWVKKESTITSGALLTLSENLRQRQFDGCIIFTVYSQSALPAAMLAWMSGIPKRLAYSRENPYDLLTDWLPDEEPYSFIRHQVTRDLALVKTIEAVPEQEEIILKYPLEATISMVKKLKSFNIDLPQSFILFNPCVSEPKRLFPEDKWVALIEETIRHFNLPIYLTGSKQEQLLTERIQKRSGNIALSIAGLLDIPELAALISKASLLVSVNTGPVHIAAGVQTPVVVLYAQTNPQHTPWMVPHQVLEYSVPEEMCSRNEVIRYVNKLRYHEELPLPEIRDIILAMESVLKNSGVHPA
jgi:lipopolysaccharide heptosyltransferase II